MKKTLIAMACVAAILFESCSGCKEVPPVINFGNQKVSDTTYVLTSVPTPQPHNILVEEFTGQSCSNCPAARSILDQNVAGNAAGRINVISMFQNIGAQSSPTDSSTYDFESDDAKNIGYSTIYVTYKDGNYEALPGAGIDRTPLTAGTTTWLGSGAWTGIINTRLATADSVNLDVSSTYKNGVATIIAKITYTQAVSSLQNLSIAVVQDSIIDWQDLPLNHTDSKYLFNDVLVGFVTPVPFGDAILDAMATKEAGRVVQRVYSYTVPTAFKKGIVTPEHCRVVAFVHRPSSTSPDFQVLQSQQTKLMGP